MIDPVRASFDRIAEQYAEDFADELTRKPWDTERLRRFAATCAAGPVLDVGCCAAGHVGRFLADHGAAVIVGVDFSERSVAVAARLNPTLRFLAADILDLPIADGTCSGVVAFYCLIYGSDDPTRVALTELRRVLRRGGRLLVAVHAGVGAQRFSDYKGTPVDVELHHRQPAAFASLVRSVGFVVESVEVRPPYAFEHATERLYVTARAG